MRKILLQYCVLIVLALGLSFCFSELGKMIFPLNKIWVFGIIFINTLNIQVREIINLRKERTFIMIATLMRVVVIPIVVYTVAGFWVPHYQIPLTLLVLAPVAMMSSTYTNLLGGKPSLSLALTVLTGILMSFWIPVFITLFMGYAVTLTPLELITDLATVLILPIVISEILQVFYKPGVTYVKQFSQILTFIFLFFILFGALSSQIDQLLTVDIRTLSETWGLISILLFTLGLFGWGMASFRKRPEIISVVTSFMLPNYSLALYLSSEFFTKNPFAILVMVLTIIPWHLSLLVLGNITGSSKVRYVETP